MPGVITTLGLSKIAAAKAANRKLMIGKIAIGSLNQTATVETTTIGTEEATQERVHVLYGVRRTSVSFSGIIDLQATGRTRLVGVYDVDGDLIVVDRLAIPAYAGETDKNYIITVTLMTEETEVFDSAISYPTAYLSSSEVGNIERQAFDYLRVKVPNAQEGQILRRNQDSNLVGGWMLEQAMIVDNADDFEMAKNTIVPMTEIFDTWYRFSHGSGNPPTYPKNSTELSGWKMVGDILEGTINSGSLIGFISPNKVLDYKFDVIISSTNGDDDVGGLVVAFNIENGIEHCLTILRSPGGWREGYELVYNRSQFNEQMIFNGNSLVKWGNGNYGATLQLAEYAHTTATSWVTLKKMRIRIERNGDLLKIWTSEWGTEELVPGSLIEVNMADFPVLSPLRKPASYGYANWSQPAMRYTTLEMTQPSQTILDLRTGNFYTYENNEWVVKSSISQNAGSMFGANRFIYSPINKNTYFTDSNGIPFRVI